MINSGVECHVGGMPACIVMYADDLVLLACRAAAIKYLYWVSGMCWYDVQCFKVGDYDLCTS